MSNYHTLEVAGRGSETQLQVGENLKKNYLLYLFKASRVNYHIPRISLTCNQK